MSALAQRFHHRCAQQVDDQLPIVVGCREDYLALKAHHYRPGHPATMSRILVIRDLSPTPTDRYLHRPPVARPVAVLIESLPVLSCRLREVALLDRYSHLRPRMRSMLLMQEIRCISRVIVDPRFRGLGLAVRLVRHALATATTRYTEALAVMGRISPFFARAGMLAYERPPLPADERALAVLRFAGIEPCALAMPAALTQRIHAMPADTGALVTRELSRWYRTAGGRGVVQTPTLLQILTAAQQRLLAQPIYYLYENKHVTIEPDHRP